MPQILRNSTRRGEIRWRIRRSHQSGNSIQSCSATCLTDGCTTRFVPKTERTSMSALIALLIRQEPSRPIGLWFRAAHRPQPFAHHIGAEQVAFFGAELLGKPALQMGGLGDDE